jgi:uncharacterized protein YyaL (SSP411 family)/aryl-alcohol dehydrogenase-like predicted oxidoreductase
MSEASAPRKNRLALETSPYLLQHASNPVDWFPWGPEALGRAIAEDKPILLSIGYAACHWCHVMERESFENDAVARLMNESFVCIKVDREERPDLDDIYMSATVAMTGHGGWPMTVFLTPEQMPFFAGTYFPPVDAQGRMGFTTLLGRISEMWQASRSEILEQAAELTEHVRANSTTLPSSAVGEDALDAAAAQLVGSFDADWGGFGGAPKFPPCASLALLLRVYRKKPDPTLLAIVRKTLDGMKNGGIYDHVGGGFARYSVDERWLVPHFEKMLYDNAQLVRVYLEAYQVTKDPEYARVATETLDYVVREMQAVDGGYYSATDADSEGIEGKFFVWTFDELEEVLGRPEAEWFGLHYDVTPTGNWEGVSILNTPKPLEDTAGELGLATDTLRAALIAAKKKLYDARRGRVPPLTDDKVLTSWNGLMIGAMADGARVLGERRYLESAERAASFAMSTLTREDGGLYRTAREGKAHLDAYLEDYAFLIDGLIDVYEAGGHEVHVREAERLAERMVADFGDSEGGAFFQTAHTHETLISRTREGHDGAIPNGNAIAARGLSRLASHFGNRDFAARALAAVAAYGRSIERSPRAFATTLAVVDWLLEGPVELAVVGDLETTEGRAIARAIALEFVPNRIVAHAKNPDDSAHPLLAGKTLVNGKPGLYVCRNFTCEAPVTAAGDVTASLRRSAAALSDDRVHAVGEKRTAGSATEVGTARYASRFGEASPAFVLLGSTSLTVGVMGFGSYRVDDRVRLHRQSLAAALSSGINLVDTSTNYADGHSERLIGQVLSELFAAKKVEREELIVVSKIGYAQGQNLGLVLSRRESGDPIPEVVEVGEGLAHCIHPIWLEDQLGRSLTRLGLGTLDVCLLHNPEYFLSDAARRGVPLAEARDEFYRRVTEAFRHLELEATRGRVLYYGVSSNSVVDDAGAPDATSLSRFLEAARAAGGDAHRFRVLQLPMNLLEPGAALVPNTGEGGGQTALALAAASGTAVLVNRPLNGIVDDRLIRLADPPTLPEAANLADQQAKVRTLEEEFVRVFASVLKPGKDARVKPSELFRWADALGDAAMRVSSFEEWRDIEAHQVAPRIVETATALDRVFEGPLSARFEAWKNRYLTEIEGLFGVLRRRAAERSLRRSRAIAAVVDPFLPDEAKGTSLSQKALRIAKSTPGVTTVLVGMRQPGYVADALTAAAAPRLEESVAALSALVGADVPK